jgi:hypothetical protein
MGVCCPWAMHMLYHSILPVWRLATPWGGVGSEPHDLAGGRLDALRLVKRQVSKRLTARW